jgi:signal-transduction protein with cAMP-binding, CBS, and nucleotidyltransferase domain
MSPASGTPDLATLVEQLTQHKTLGGVPRAELEWIATHGVFRHFDVGAVIATKGEPGSEMVIILAGVTEQIFDRGSGRRCGNRRRFGRDSARASGRQLQPSRAMGNPPFVGVQVLGQPPKS